MGAVTTSSTVIGSNFVVVFTPQNGGSYNEFSKLDQSLSVVFTPQNGGSYNVKHLIHHDKGVVFTPQNGGSYNIVVAMP